jgi:2'-5' RNA ligase
VRLFIGIEIDDAVRARAAAIAASAGLLLDAALTIRWVPPENFHLTVWFLGEVVEPRAAAILQALDRPFETPAFDLHIARLGAFPPSGVPRVLWLGVEEGQEPLARIHSEIAARLQPLGIAPERESFSAHLTLGRVKAARRSIRPRDLRDRWRGLPADAGVCRIGGVTLFRSVPSSKGSAYEALLRVPLK